MKKFLFLSLVPFLSYANCPDLSGHFPTCYETSTSEDVKYNINDVEIAQTQTAEGTVYHITSTDLEDNSRSTESMLADGKVVTTPETREAPASEVKTECAGNALVITSRFSQGGYPIANVVFSIYKQGDSLMSEMEMVNQLGTYRAQLVCNQ